jgi:hypothetical protein
MNYVERLGPSTLVPRRWAQLCHGFLQQWYRRLPGAAVASLVRSVETLEAR